MPGAGALCKLLNCSEQLSPGNYGRWLSIRTCCVGDRVLAGEKRIPNQSQLVPVSGSCDMLANLDRRLARDLLDLYGLVMGYLGSGGTTLIYYNPAGLDCSWNALWQRNLTHHPQIVWQNSYPCPDLYNQFNGDIQVLACLPSDALGELQLRNLVSSLQHLLAVPVLVEVVDLERQKVKLAREKVDLNRENVASEYLSICMSNRLPNVELYFRDSQDLLFLYSYQTFPQFRLIKRSISGSDRVEIFCDKLRNLQGHTLRALPDLSPPNTFDYRDNKGQVQLAGYLWDFVVTYAGIRNASVEWMLPSWRDGSASASSYMLEFAANGTVDFGLTTVLITKRSLRFLDYYTYPILSSAWCTMLPVERPIPTNDLYGRIICPMAVVLLLVIVLLGYLAFGYMDSMGGFPTWLRILPRLLALLLLTTSTAQLQSLLISPPHYPRIGSFDDLLHSGIQILGVSSEFYNMDGAFRAKYAAAFHLTPDPNVLYDLRNHFNSSWAYTIAQIKWDVMKQQQRFFYRPLFRMSKDLCFFDYVPTSIVLAPDSIYYESLKHFTLNAAQAGFFKYWIGKSFYDMVAAGRMTIRDYSELVELRPLAMADLLLTWHIFGAAIAVASSVFVLELIVFYVNVFFDSL